MNAPVPTPPQRKSYIIPVIISVLILSSFGIIINIMNVMNREKEKTIGDGVHIESYGFDLANLKVPKENIAVSGLPKDGLENFDHPEFIPIAAVDEINEEIRGKYQVSRDRVVGLRINGDARAYPIRILQWHEVINDEVGGVPVAVTYSPFGDSVVVFDRRVNGKTLEFAESGLLYNSTLLMFDRREDPAQESLWSQLQFRAVSGPEAKKGTTLKTLPCEMSRWDDWKERYPDSKVIKPNTSKMRQYQADPYGRFHSMDTLQFEVIPMPPEDQYKNKTGMMILQWDDDLYPVPYPVVVENKKDENKWRTQIGGHEVVIRYTDFPEACAVVFDESSLPEDAGVMYAFQFAWYSHHPDVEYVKP